MKGYHLNHQPLNSSLWLIYIFNSVVNTKLITCNQIIIESNADDIYLL